MYSSEEKLWAMLSYVLSFVAAFIAPLVIFFLMKDRSKFVAFHAMQALMIHLFAYVLGAVLTATIILAILDPVIGFVALAFLIVCAVKAYAGEEFEVPVIGKIARQAAGI